MQRAAGIVGDPDVRGSARPKAAHNLSDELRVGSDAGFRGVRAEQIRLDPDPLAGEVVFEEIERLVNGRVQVSDLADEDAGRMNQGTSVRVRVQWRPAL